MRRAARPAGAGRKRGRPSASTSSAIAGAGRWEELPEELLLMVLDRLPSVVDLLAFVAVCRSWRALAGPTLSSRIGRGSPPLLLTHVRSRRLHPQRCRLLSPAGPAPYFRCLIPPSTFRSHVIGCSHGNFIFRDCPSYRSCRLVLADVVTGDVLRPPELDRDSYQALRNHWVHRGVLTAPLSAPDCSLLLVTTSGVLLRWQVGEQGYSEYMLLPEWRRPPPNTLLEIELTIFRGQILAWNLIRSMLFLVEFSPHFSVRELVFQKQWKGSVSYCSPFPQQLVECGGELMLVHCVTVQGFFIEVEVLRLDLSEPPSWVKVESLGETALFINELGGVSVSCPNPSRWGGRSNCIYLARQPSDNWLVLPLDGGAINVKDPNSPFYFVNRHEFSPGPADIWVYPSMFY